MGWRNVWYKICIILILCGCYETQTNTEYITQDIDVVWNVSNENRVFTLTDEQYTLLEEKGQLFMLIRMSGKSSGALSSSTIGSLTATCGTYWNGLHVVGGASSKLYTSPDGNTWTSRTIGATPYDFVVSGSYLIAGCYDYIYRTSDGTTWTNEATTSRDISNHGYHDGTYAVMQGQGYTFYSTNDGDSWSSHTDGFFASTYGNGVYVALGIQGPIPPYGFFNHFISWTDEFLGTWDDIEIGDTADGLHTGYYFCRYYNGVFFARADTSDCAVNKMYYSNNGSSWTLITIGTKLLNDVFYDERIQVNGDDTWFVCGNDGTLYYSHNITTWTSLSTTTTDDFVAMYTDGTCLYVVSAQGNLWRLIQ